jgi:hypothetical protein
VCFSTAITTGATSAAEVCGRGSARIVAAVLAGAVLLRFLVASALAFTERKLQRHRASQTLHVPEAAEDIVYVELVSLDAEDVDAEDIGPIRLQNPIGEDGEKAAAALGNLEVGDHILLKDEAGVRSSMEGTGHSWNSTRPACVGKEWVITAMRTPKVFKVPGSPFEWPLGSIQEVLPSSAAPVKQIHQDRCDVARLAWLPKELQKVFARVAGLAMVVAGITLTAYAHKVAIGALCVPDGNVEWLGGRVVLSWCTALAAACACCSYLLTGCTRALGRVIVWPLLILATFADCVLVNFLWRDVVAMPAHHIVQRDPLGLLLHVLLQVPHSACFAFFIGPFWAAALLPAVSDDWDGVVELSPSPLFVFVPALVAALPFATVVEKRKLMLTKEQQQEQRKKDFGWLSCGHYFQKDGLWKFIVRSKVFMFVYWVIYWRFGVMDTLVGAGTIDSKNRFNYQRHPLVAPLCDTAVYGASIVLYAWVILISAASCCSKWLRPRLVAAPAPELREARLVELEDEVARLVALELTRLVALEDELREIALRAQRPSLTPPSRRSEQEPEQPPTKAVAKGGKKSASSPPQKITVGILRNFYLKHDPSKAGNAEKIIAKFSTEQIMKLLMDKFQEVPDLACQQAEQH